MKFTFKFERVDFTFKVKFQISVLAYQELGDRPFHSRVTKGSYHSNLFFHALPGSLEKAPINRIF